MVLPIGFCGRAACALPSARGDVRRRLRRLARSTADLARASWQRPGCACLPANRLLPRRLPVVEQPGTEAATASSPTAFTTSSRAPGSSRSRSHRSPPRRSCSAVATDSGDCSHAGRAGRSSRLGGARHLGGVSVRARHRARTALDLGTLRGKRWRFGILAVLIAAASPLAFLLLAIFLAGIGLGMRDRGRHLLALTVIIAAVGASQFLLARAFSDGGRYLFRCSSSARSALFARSARC